MLKQKVQLNCSQIMQASSQIVYWSCSTSSLNRFIIEAPSTRFKLIKMSLSFNQNVIWDNLYWLKVSLRSIPLSMPYPTALQRNQLLWPCYICYPYYSVLLLIWDAINKFTPPKKCKRECSIKPYEKMSICSLVKLE